MRPALAVTLLACAATSACGHGRAEDGGPAVSRNYTVGGFDQIEVAGPYNVQVRTGSGPTVAARGPEKMLDRMVVEVKGDKLVIHSPEQRGFHFGWSSYRGQVDVVVTVPQIQAAAIKGSGDISVDKVQGDRFDGSVAGSGDLEVGSVQVADLKLSIAGSGSAKAVSGSAQNAKYDIAGSGDIDTRGVAADDADVSIAGSGSVAAQAKGRGNVSIMGSGDVVMTGGAKCNVSKVGSGTARCS